MTDRRRWISAALAACAVVATSCGHPSSVLERTDATATERIVVRGGPIRYGNVVTRREGTILHAQVELVNTSSSDQSFEYRWEWTDASGFQLGDTLSSWQPGFIGGKERKLMTGAGPGPSAADFRLYIRKPE
jgi:uncharacterized protein YcfL